ncbi:MULTISPECIES: AMP-binding protein [Nocardiaceae]|uniref:AMP-binding protein n=1 Tax=Nocardiaceae TaxID=85025 RepID=UPI000B0E20C5|nr:MULTISPECIES: AMP-binding protein [Rhodococcus]
MTATVAASRRAMNLAEMLTTNAKRIPDRPAVVCGPVRWSWKDLDAAVNLLAGDLRRRGVAKGDVVLVHSPNHVEFVQAMFAIWRVGAILAPTNARITPGDAASIAAVCKPVALVSHRDCGDHAAAIADAVDLTAGTLWIASEGADSIAALADTEISASDVFGNEGVDSEDHAWYFFTSGTSGTPKAAILTHFQLSFVINNHLADLMPGTSEDDASLVVAPLSHGAGVHLLPQVAAGAATILTESASLDGNEVWATIAREHVSNVFTVPTILKKLVEHPAVHEHDHSSLEYVIYAGAPMYAVDQEAARKVLGDVLVQYYGLGEVTGNITVLRPGEHGRKGLTGVDFGSCGRPRTGMHVVVLAEDGTAVPTGEQGQICVAGPAVCAGYLDNDSANAEAFRDGWFHTGDLGRFDEQGFLYITGRASDMYISGGSNVYPREIEEKILKHPSVIDVAVVGILDPVWGEIGVAVWVCSESDATTSEELSAWLAPSVAKYKLPRHFVQWSALPTTAYGKVAKKDVKAELKIRGVEAVAVSGR